MLYLNLIPSLNPESSHSLTLHIISYYYLKAGIRITRYASSLFSCSVCSGYNGTRHFIYWINLEYFACQFTEITKQSTVEKINSHQTATKLRLNLHNNANFIHVNSRKTQRNWAISANYELHSRKWTRAICCVYLLQLWKEMWVAAH